MITVDGYDADPEGTKMCVTSYNWTFHGNHKLQAVGKNIKIANTKKQTASQIQTITESIKEGAVQKILTYYNADAFEMGATPFKIARIMVPVSEKTSVLVTGQIILNVTKPGTAKITYKLNDDPVKFSPQQILPEEGYYMLNLLYRLQDIVESSQNIFEVYIESEDGEASVEAENCLINMSGSGIVKSDSWDGSLVFAEGITAIYLGTINMNAKYADTLNVALHSYFSRDMYENYITVYLGTKWQYPVETCNVTLHEKTPMAFDENYKSLQFSFGGLNISDEINISVEAETATAEEITELER